MYQKKKMRALITVLIMLCCCLCLSGCGKTAQDLALEKYLISETSGCDGYGSVQFYIDVNKIANDFDLTQEVAGQLKELCNNREINAQIDNNGNLSNGNKILVNWNENQKMIDDIALITGTKVTLKNAKTTITNIPPVVEFNPFESDLIVDTHGTESGKGVIDFRIHKKTADGEEFSWTVKHDKENGSIKNGDVLTLTIADDINEELLAKKFGAKISTKTYSYEVTNLNEPITSNDAVYWFSAANINNVTKAAKEWIVSGLCDNAPPKQSDRRCEYIGNIFYSNKHNHEEGETLVCIYRINDAYIGDYYSFLALNGKFSATENFGWTINNGQDLPTDYIEYDKEYVRYTPEEGWDEGCEEMGFLVDGFPYAGHQTLESLLTYLDNHYGTEYIEKYQNATIDNELQLEKF